jgi:uncharacterized protein (DUF885 family)
MFKSPTFAPIAFVASIAALASACGHNGHASEPHATTSDLAAHANTLVESYLDRLLDQNPSMARTLGLHAYDGKVAPISQARVDLETKEARAFLDATRDIDLASLQDPLRLDVELCRLAAERAIFTNEVRRVHRSIMGYDGLFDVSTYLVRDYAPLEQRTTGLLDQIEGASAQVDALLAILDPKQPRTHLETAKKMLSGMREYYEGDVNTGCKPALDSNPALKARFERVIAAGLASVDRIIRWIDDVGMKNATNDFALGKGNFLEMLRVNEGLDMSLDDLEKMSQANFKKNYDAFVQVAKQIDPGASVKQVADRVANDRLPRDKVLETAKRELDELLSFIEGKGIVTVPGKERAIVAVTPPFQRWNSAFLNNSGPFESASGNFYYISPPDPSWPKEMQDSYIPYEGDLLSTSVHEVYPGHFVQSLHQRLAKTRAQKMLDSYAFVEGWAHYVEEMMFDEGYGGGDPRLKLGQLSNALLRNCRFVAAIGLHTKGMTVEQADKLFQEQCFIDPGNAIQQAYRGTFDPGYLSYTLGKLEILDLRKAYFAKYPTKSLHDFHDWILSFGAAPLELIRHRL